MPNFIEIGQTSLEKSVRKNWASDKKKYFVTDGSRASQRATGATKKLTTGLDNDFDQGFRPGPQWGSLQYSPLIPSSWGEGSPPTP